MYPAPIEHYFKPATFEEACQLARDATGECMFIAGGMSLMQAMKSRMLAPDCVIDLNGIAELKGVSREDGVIRIGAMTRYRGIEENAAALSPFDAMTDAAAHVGDRQVRNRGTVGGSLAWNYVSACTPVAALACNARVSVLRAAGDKETIAIDDFLVGPMATALDDGDLVLSIELTPPARAAGSAYRKWGIVQDALPVVGVGVCLELDAAGRCASGRFAVGGLSSGPQRAAAAEAMLTDALDLDDAAALRACAAAAAGELEADDDPWVSADYKHHLIERLGAEMLEKAVARARSTDHE